MIPTASLAAAVLGAIANLHWGLLVAAASAGVLIHSARSPISAARFRPEDITAKYPPGPADPNPVAVFPEDDIRLDIRNVLESRAGFELRVSGTIGGVLAGVLAAFTRIWNVPSGLFLNLAAAAVVGLLGHRAGRWWKERSGRNEIQERDLVHCFLLWLEDEAIGQEAKGHDFGLTVVSTARYSGFTLMGSLLLSTLGVRLSDAENKATARRVLDLAREYGYTWRNPEMQKWADEVSKSG